MLTAAAHVAVIGGLFIFGSILFNNEDCVNSSPAEGNRLCGTTRERAYTLLDFADSSPCRRKQALQHNEGESTYSTTAVHAVLNRMRWETPLNPFTVPGVLQKLSHSKPK